MNLPKSSNNSTSTFALADYPLLKALLQVMLIGTVWCVSVVIEHFFNLPISSGVLGLFIMLVLLFSGAVKLSWVQLGAKLILGELVLLFIPLMMSLIKFKALFLTEGWQLIVTIVFSTAMVMLSSALTFVLGNRIHRKIYRAKHRKTTE